MTMREIENPRARGYASGARSRSSVLALKTQRQKNSRTAFLLQSLAHLTSGIFSLFGAFIDLRAVAWSVRVAVRRDAEVRHG